MSEPTAPHRHPHDRRSRIDSVTLAGVGFLMLSVAVGIFGYRASHDAFDLNLLLTDYYANLSTELGSIAVVIIVVDRLNRRQERRGRETARLQQQLLHDLRAAHSEDARKALDIVTQRGWLWDGSLEDANLTRANLRGAVLSIRQARNIFGGGGDLIPALRGADLRQADLRDAVLLHADLRDANLKGALLEGADVTGVICNANTVLPDETLWSAETDFARFTDPSHANFWHAPPKHP